MGEVMPPYESLASIDQDWLDELEACLLVLDDTDLHCDGVSSSISAVLSESNIKHDLMWGVASDLGSGDVVAPHSWIALPHQHVIDFRLRMWLGEESTIPHGLFRGDIEVSGIQYIGDALTELRFPRKTLDMMTQGRIEQIRLPPPPAWAISSR